VPVSPRAERPVDALEKYDLIYAVISRIPRGYVTTYGRIAAAAGFPRHARMVGRALRAAPDDADLPWHRVLNAQGRISAREEPSGERDQRRLLEAEGVTFRNGRAVLSRHLWDPEAER